MHVEGDRLLCSCGSAVTIDDCYNLIPDDSDEFPFTRIDKWYSWQREVIAEEVLQDGFLMQEDVVYQKLNTQNLWKGRHITLGEGRIELDQKQLRYTGTREGEPVELEFDIARIPSLTVSTSLANEFYYDGEFFQFVIKGGPGRAFKLMIVSEILHDAVDSVRRRAREDVKTKD